eukprot:6214065-Pleurochrysis_carterae.AAC.2
MTGKRPKYAHEHIDNLSDRGHGAMLTDSGRARTSSCVASSWGRMISSFLYDRAGSSTSSLSMLGAASDNPSGTTGKATSVDSISRISSFVTCSESAVSGALLARKALEERRKRMRG